MTLAGYEFLDRVEKHVQHVLIHRLDGMVVTGQLDVFGARDFTRQVPSAVDRNQHVAHSMEDQGGYPDRRQKITDVILEIRPHQGEDRTRARDGSLQSAEPLDKRLVADPS